MMKAQDLTSKEASVLFKALMGAKTEYEKEKRMPIAPMPGGFAFEQGYQAGYLKALESSRELLNALKSLVDDASLGEDGFWRLGPYADSTDSRLAHARRICEESGQ